MFYIIIIYIISCIIPLINPFSLFFLFLFFFGEEFYKIDDKFVRMFLYFYSLSPLYFFPVRFPQIWIANY